MAGRGRAARSASSLSTDDGGTAPRDLTSNSNGLKRERVGDIQRARLLAAMAEVAAEHGAANVTVAHVVERAGVSRRTFYELFEDREDCFLAALGEALERVAARVAPAHLASGRWRERVRAALTALLEYLDEEPHMARLLVVETLAAGHRSLERRTRVLAHVIAAVAEGGDDAKAAPAATRLTAEGVVGAVLSLIHNRLLGESDERLIALVNPLMSMIVLPYLGPAAARRELERPVRKTPVRGRPVDGNPLRELHMRLTYRTVRVLVTVASHPGASNRAIADASGITDQGQISKLLARLERLGLIGNTGAPSGRGEPNAWRLTQLGWRVHTTIADPAVLPGP
jgi:AcrR family transcriptional regulator